MRGINFKICIAMINDQEHSPFPTICPLQMKSIFSGPVDSAHSVSTILNSIHYMSAVFSFIRARLVRLCLMHAMTARSIVWSTTIYGGLRAEQYHLNCIAFSGFLTTQQNANLVFTYLKVPQRPMHTSKARPVELQLWIGCSMLILHASLFIVLRVEVVYRYLRWLVNVLVLS